MTTQSTIDQQFVEYVIKSLVDHPDDVQITRTVDSQGIFIQLKVHPEDLGRVIGKGGTTATSIRRLLYALGSKNREVYKFKILDENEQPNLDGPKPREAFVASAMQSKPETGAVTEEPVTEVAEEKTVIADKEPEAEVTEEVAEVKDEPVVEPTAEPVKEEMPVPMVADPVSDTAPYEKTENLTDKTLKELKDLDDLDL